MPAPDTSTSGPSSAPPTNLAISDARNLTHETVVRPPWYSGHPGTPDYRRCMAANDAERIRLVVLFGGQSAEHEVSLVTARHVLAATDADRYEIEPIAILKDGRWIQADDAARALTAGPEALP